MIFTIHRCSDEFMDCDLPNPDWSPHNRAVFSVRHGNWIIDIKSVDDLIGLSRQEGIPIAVTAGHGEYPRLEIKDI